MFTKESIKKAIIHGLFDGLSERSYAEHSGHIGICPEPEPVKHKYFYLALNGELGNVFNAELSYILSNDEKTDCLVLTGKRVVAGMTYFRFNSTSNLPEKRRRRSLDIVCVEKNSIGTVGPANVIYASRKRVKADSAIITGHGTLGVDGNNLINRMPEELYICQSMGIPRSFFIGLLCDIRPGEIRPEKEISVKHFSRIRKFGADRSQSNARITMINQIRALSERLDESFIHLIIGGSSMDVTVYIHVFIVELKIHLKFSAMTHPASIEKKVVPTGG